MREVLCALSHPVLPVFNHDPPNLTGMKVVVVLGLLKGQPRGRGVSGKQALDLCAKLAQSQAVRTGVLTELADAELVIEGIGHNKVSDITTNILRRRLISYTQDQCRLHGIPLNGTVASGGLWDPLGGRWAQEHVQLPIVNRRRVVLVPKALVRWEMAIDHQEYYRHFVLNFLQKEALADRVKPCRAPQERAGEGHERRASRSSTHSVRNFSINLLGTTPKSWPSTSAASVISFRSATATWLMMRSMRCCLPVR